MSYDFNRNTNQILRIANVAYRIYFRWFYRKSWWKRDEQKIHREKNKKENSLEFIFLSHRQTPIKGFNGSFALSLSTVFFLQFSTYLNSYRLTSWRQSVRLYSIQFCSRTFSISILPNFTTTTKFALETLQFQRKFHDGKAANTYSICLMASKRKTNIGNSRRNSFKSMDVCHRWQKKIVGIECMSVKCASESARSSHSVRHFLLFIYFYFDENEKLNFIHVCIVRISILLVEKSHLMMFDIASKCKKTKDERAKENQIRMVAVIYLMGIWLNERVACQLFYLSIYFNHTVSPIIPTTNEKIKASCVCWWLGCRSIRPDKKQCKSCFCHKFLFQLAPDRYQRAHFRCEKKDAMPWTKTGWENKLAQDKWEKRAQLIKSREKACADEKRAVHQRERGSESERPKWETGYNSNGNNGNSYTALKAFSQGIWHGKKKILRLKCLAKLDVLMKPSMLFFASRIFFRLLCCAFL